MAKINKPLFLSKIWALNGTVAPSPDDTRIDQGFIVEKPPYQHHNWVLNRSDTAIAHISQMGIPEWDQYTEYRINLSWTLGSDGAIYACKLTHTNQDPIADISETYWLKVLTRDKALRVLDTTAWSRGFLLSASGSAGMDSLGMTVHGKQISTSASPSATRVLLEAGAVGDAVFLSTTQLAAKTAIGVASATEVVEGTVIRAADAEFNGVVTQDTKYVTPRKLQLGFSANLNSNGNITLPTWLGGFSMRWGNVTLGSNSSTTVTTFPVACLNAQVSVASSSTDASQAMNVSISGASVLVVNPESSARSIYWFAVGR